MPCFEFGRNTPRFRKLLLRDYCVLDETEFLQAVVPDITWCLGMRLRPVCIGHRLTLKRLQSPFFNSGLVSYATLREAVLVLAHSFERGIELLNGPSLPLKLWLWHARLTCFGVRRIQLQRSVDLLTEHIGKSKRFNPLELPTVESDGGCDMSCTTEWVLVTMLMQKFGMSLSEALNCPWAIAHWLHAAAAEMTGCVKIGNPQGLEDAMAESDRAHVRIGELIAKGVIKR